MKRLRKVLLILLALVIVALVAGFFGLNMYVQSPGTQARIQAQLSETLGTPLEITSISIGWGGAKANGIKIPDGQRTFLEANRFSAEFRLVPLLSKRLLIDKMVLESPKVIWAQNAEGKWVLPALPEKARKENPTLPAGPKPAATPTPESRFQVLLDKLEITNGSIELRDSADAPIAVATDVEMRYTLSTPGHIEGTVLAKKVVWQSALTFQEVQSPMTFSKGELTLSSLRAKAAGGVVEGSFTVQTEAKDSPYQLDLNLTGVDLQQVATEGGWEAKQAGGSVAGKLSLEGTLKKLNRTEGKGELTLANGYFQGLNLFESIADLLQIPELSDLRVRTGKADFRIKDEKTYVDDLVLEAASLRFSTKGYVRFDGKLSLDAQLALSSKTVQQLPQFVRTNFSAPDANDRQAIDFDITGKTDKPKTNLFDRVIGKKVNTQLDSLLDNIFGSKKKEPKKEKKKKDEPDKLPGPDAPTAAPAAPPAPTATPAPAAPKEP